MSDKRLIEVAFPLEQVSLDSVHEKNVRHGHISTLHIWPARRPLAASRAALIATLLPDPGNAREREAIYRRMAGRVVETVGDERVGGRTVARRRRETQGGILHWKREAGQDLDWFRARIRDGRNGRAPRVLDPFAGGGAIPLEAMRLGCEVTAVDLNPVAWFILKCTLDYPRRLAGKTRPLPAFALRDGDFVAAFLEARGVKGRALKRELADLGLGEDRETEPKLLDSAPEVEADLAWQVRAWGRRVLWEARRPLASRYPTYAAYRALKPGGRPFESRPLTLLAPDGDGNPDVAPLNVGFDAVYLKDPAEPALAGDADRGVPVGAHGPLQGVPRDHPAAQDGLARQEGRQARAADDDTERRAHRRRVRGRGRRISGRGQPGRAARARPADRRRHDEPVRRAVPPLPVHHDDAGPPPRRPRRAAE